MAMRRRAVTAVLWAALLLLAGPLAPVAAQVVSVGLSISPQFPALVTVGQTSQPASMTIANTTSTGVGPVTVTEITLNPACGSLSLDCAPPDPGVFGLSPTATGTAGVCTGRTFAITAPDANGRSTFVPAGSPMVLAQPGMANSTCAMAFTFSVLKAPTVDAQPNVGLQTAHVATVTGTGEAGNVTGTGVARGLQTSNVVAEVGGRFRPLTPARILDTRTGTGGVAAALGPATTIDLQVAGHGGVPASGVSAVALNVTVTQPTGDGYLTAYPTGTTRPVVSNLNFTPGDTVPNLVVVRLGAGGRVSMFNATGSSHLVVDVTGWYSDAGTGNEGRYQALVPARVLDTRVGIGGGARLGPGASVEVQVSGSGGLPAAGAAAAVLNLTATEPTATSFVTVHPTGEARPLASNLNFDAGETVANRVMAKLGAGGRVTIYNGSGSVDLIVDVGGWYTEASVAGATGSYTPLDPVRIVDTRLGLGGVLGPTGGGTTVAMQVAGQGGVPVTGVSAVILNVTAVGPVAGGWLALYPTGAPQPNASDLNVAPGQTRANLVVVRVGADGKVNVFSSVATHFIFDVAGWYT